jgi:3-hydroxyacyl-[acyl-carrier-protein] dehydratase
VDRVLTRTDIEGILPHRDPFLFVDEILEITPGEKIVGVVKVSNAGMFLHHHESGRSFLPPTILTEAMAQVGAVLVLHPEDNRGRTIYFRSIEDTRFHKKVPAGSTLRVEGEVRRLRARLGSLKMNAFLNDELVAEGVMGFAL